MWPESAQAVDTITVNLQSLNRLCKKNTGHRITNLVVNLALDPTMLKSFAVIAGFPLECGGGMISQLMVNVDLTLSSFFNISEFLIGKDCCYQESSLYGVVRSMLLFSNWKLLIGNHPSHEDVEF